MADEVDDDRTPPRGVSAPLSGVDHPVPRPPRSLPTYDRRNDPTIVLPRRAVFRRSRRIMLAPRQLVAVVVACVVTVCAGAFMLGAAISSAWQERATTAEPEPAHGVTLPEVTVPAPEAESGDKPLTLSDLPVERAATK